MIADLRNYVVGLFFGMVALFIAFLLAFGYMSLFVWHTAGRADTGYDIVSLFIHYSSLPSVWITTLLVFAMGFYLPLRRRLGTRPSAPPK